MAIITEVAECLELDGMHYGADTSGCPIKCIPDLIRKRAYQLFEARGGGGVMNWMTGCKLSVKSNITLGLQTVTSNS